ncbi:hypothetical protein LCGC14_0540110 [marine sediment metagenome]|uniref:Uncharacterized protein n=1 Tax=marine sediment metagenome TaxID=412755 RepID=A0A0F9RXP5_9ZZZZ
MKYINKIKRNRKSKKLKAKRKKQLEKRNLQEARKIYRSLPKSIKQTRLKKIYYYAGIISSTIIIIYFILAFIRDAGL